MVDHYITSMKLNGNVHHFAGRQTVWISDGHHTVHMMDITSAVNENDERESDEKLLRISGFVNRHISLVENYELCHIYTLTFIKLWKCWYMPGIVLIYFEVGSFCILCELSESSMIWRT